ncbi:reverse transcriptase [Tanacetum coccineum]
MFLQLKAPLLQVEIDKVVKDLGAHKAPGEDGFSSIFFQKYWHIVGDTISKDIQQFFDHGILPQSLNKNTSSLTSKGPFSDTIGQFCPTSLCNFVYRVISKVMANRLKPFMHCIISPQQSAFIPGRLIQDCMIVANEAFHCIRNKKKGEQKVMALNLDLNKAIDRVEWDLLMETCRKLGFEDKWCSWVLVCISSYEMDFMINGDSIGTIRPSKDCEEVDGASENAARHSETARDRFLTATKGSHPSWLWHNLLQGRYILLRGLRWQLGNGSNILFRIQKWVPYSKDFYVQHPCSPFASNSVVSDFIINGAWDLPKLELAVLQEETKVMWLGSALYLYLDNMSGPIILCVQDLFDMVPSTSEREIFSASSPFMAELYAIHSACRLAVTYGWQNVMVGSDYKVAISLACVQVDPPWSLSAIVVDIKV